MGELRLNAIRLNTVSLNTMPINSIGFKKKASLPSSGDVDENGYIIFADPEVARICAENWGDGTGITKEQAAAVTSIGTVFSGNTEIKSFNELGLFGGDEGVSVSFLGCANLESVDLSNVVGGTESGAFSGLDSLHIDIDMSRLKTFPYAGFRKSAITGVKNLGLITSIPAAYAYIENGAFYECTELKYANIPEVITTLPMALFAGCSALSEIHLAWEKIERIEGNVFLGCTSLEIEDLLLPNLVSLGSTAFTNVKIKKISNLGHLTSLPNSWNGTFGYGDPSVLEEVVLPDAITEIPGNSFSYYTSLHNINLPKTITSIGKAAFSGSAINIELDLPNLIALGSQSFRASGITKIINLGSITRLENESSGWATFSLCKNLTSVVLPDTLEYIGNNSFNGCTSLESVYFGGTKTIGEGAFSGCTSLKIEDLQLPNLETLGSNAFYGVKIKKISNLGSITTLNRRIGDASVLEEIVLPDTITSIPNDCFKNYSALKSIKMDGVTTMSGNAFQEATLLNEFVAPNLTTANGEYGLYKSGIWKFVAPKLTSTNSWLCAYTPNIRLVLLRDITTINARSFSDNSTYEAFVCLNPTPPTLAWNALKSTNIEGGTGSIYVPDGTTTDADGNTITIVEAYKAATNWSTYASRIFPISQLATDNPELYSEIEEYL